MDDQVQGTQTKLALMKLSNFERDMKDSKGMPVVGCMPGCAHEHKHAYEQDFTKNHWDPLDERAGYFKDFNQELDQKKKANPDGKDVLFTCNQQSYDLCTFGCKGTPINLNTSIKQLRTFKDDVFNASYAPIYPTDQRRYKESGQQFQIVMEGKPEDNVMQTKTISLFDKHIEKATLHGL